MEGGGRERKRERRSKTDGGRERKREKERKRQGEWRSYMAKYTVSLSCSGTQVKDSVECEASLPSLPGPLSLRDTPFSW